MAATSHPFITGEAVHFFEPARKPAPSLEQIRAALNVSVKPDLDPIAIGQPMKRSFALNVPMLAAAIALAVPTAAAFATIPVSRTSPIAAEANTGIVVPSNHPVGHMLPDNYPGIYPGEQVVYYYLAPLSGQETTERRDSNGCIWQVGINDTKMGIGYPVIGDGGTQKCTDATKAIAPYRARMIGRTLPEIKGSRIQIVDIIDPRTNLSILPTYAAPTPAPPAASAVSELPAQALIPPGMKDSERPAPADLAKTSRPAPEPGRGAKPSRSASYSAAPSADEMVSMSAAAEQMVPITQDAFSQDDMVPLTGEPTRLRAIRPGEPMAASQPLSARHRPGNRPAGPPLDPAS